MTVSSLADRFDVILTILDDVRDIIDGRVADPLEPQWSAARGWTGFLLGLSDEQLQRCEGEGLDQCVGELSNVPPDLRELAHAVTQASWVERAEPLLGEVARERWLRVSDRKQQQIEALLEVCGELALGAERLVDVGCGAGHLTRIASRVWTLQGLGLERDEARVATAQQLASGQVEFQAVDVIDALELRSGDIAVGLHACGEVGDVLLRAASRARVSVALICCCLQKIRGDTRVALSCRGERGGLHLRRETLGLTNLCVRQTGVEAALTDITRARQNRYALRLLLQGRGLEVEAGGEMRGLNRRWSYKPFEQLVQRALELRGQVPAHREELETVVTRAREGFAMMRRWSLPRTMMARLLEMAVVLDRACFVEELGYEVRVMEVFDDEVSPRNLAVLARPEGGSNGGGARRI